MSDGAGAQRLDRWLFAVRFFKSRSAATDAVNGGKVHLNGARVKAAHALKIGDAIAFARGAVTFECTVRAIPERRGPATEAVRCYEESPASVARREQFATNMKLAAALAPRPADRPDKHQRQALRRLRGRD